MSLTTTKIKILFGALPKIGDWYVQIHHVFWFSKMVLKMFYVPYKMTEISEIGKVKNKLKLFFR